MNNESSAFIRCESDLLNINTDTELKRTMLGMEKPRLLMHACCGPCATACIERLAYEYSITVYYYNPNITDSEEYFLRRDSLKKFIRIFNDENDGITQVSYIEGVYEPDRFISKVRGLEAEPEGGRRCGECFSMRLANTGNVAKQLEMDCFTTTMTVSPHKNYEAISKIGIKFGEIFGVAYLDIDFKKKNGFARSVEISKRYGLYRQRYCGCCYSVKCE